nr:MAG TPA: hypothetical protein [Caudoviricetes sp.]
MPQAEAESREVVNTEVEQESTQAESTAAETKNSEASSEPDTKAVISDSGEVVRVKVDKSKDEDKADESEDESDDDPKPKRGKEARREQLERDLDEENQAIRELVARRNQARAYRQQLEQEQAQQYQETPPEMQNQPLPTLEQIMQTENPETGDFFTEFEAKAVLQNLQLQQQLVGMQEAQEQAAYEAQVSASISGMSSDADRALRDFPEFDPESDKYDAELDAEVDKFLQGMLIYDNAGNLIGSRESIYQLYQSFHKARGEKPKRTVINDAGDFRGSGARIEKPFEKMSTKEMEAYLRRKGYDV